MAKLYRAGRRARYRYAGKGRHSLSARARIALWVLAAVAVILIAIAVYLQRFMVYSQEGGRMVFPTGANEEEAPPEVKAGMGALGQLDDG